MNKHQQGFTFIEILMVIFVIGILIGAIYQGHEMIVSARTKHIINDITGTITAVNMYRDRYRALPGDDRDGSRWPEGVSGNSNGRIDGLYNATPSNPPTSNEETNLFWWHLRQSGFLGGRTDVQEGSRQPQTVVSGNIGVQEANGALGLTGLILCASVPDKVALGIDVTIDDGNSATGSVRAMLGTFSTSLVAAPVANYAQNGDSYVVCVAARLR